MDALAQDLVGNATKSLLTQFKTAAINNGDVYVSIIPFSRDVNARGIG